MSVNIRSAEISDSKAISELILPLAKKYVCPTCDASAHDILLNSMSEENVGKYLSTNYNYVIAVTAND
ncbi:GNAT family N-acetyltransferase, partial [Vibrio splendidus]